MNNPFIYKSLSTLLVGALAVTFMVSCGNKKTNKKVELAINSANLDTSAKPGDDFYQYANGGWLKNNPIPADKSRFGAFEEIDELNTTQLKGIMEEAAADKSAKAGSIKQKIGDFYTSGMDTVKIEKDGVKAIQAELDKIDAVKTVADLQKQIAYNHAAGMPGLFNIYSAQDEKNSEKVIAQLGQGGLGLPDRDYYLATDGRSKEIRAEYQKHLVRTFVLLGQANDVATKSAETVLKIETALATASSTRLELRDPIKNYNKMDLAGVKKIAPQFDWALYFNNIGLTQTKDLNVGQPKFFTAMAKLTSTVSIDDWKTYLKWNLVRSSSSYLSSAFDKEHFAFFGTVLSGIKQMKPRWKRVVDETSGSLGEAVGQLYVEKYFPAKAKERMITLVSNLKVALNERIQNLKWMSDATKKEAEAKLAKINVKVGYPDKWIDYSKVAVSKDSYFVNVMNANRFAVRREFDKIGKPVDRAEWGMTPQTVNAYYSPNMNEIVFPAGILQPPFFYTDADDAVNYGAIGVVIGHEMTHGFDDQGRLYDKVGNLHEWWTKDDAAKFEKQTKVLIDQYDNYKILDSLHVNGKLTTGENIADLGGVNISYDALHKALQGKDQTEKIDGFTIDQRFFLSYAQVWRNNIRDQELMRRLKEDVHSPGIARVNGIVYNIPAFYKAFNIKATDKRFIPEEKRANIW
ncbi:MAG: M13 family metallopeptidase [Bacteroidetes bacterium]|nr:M13 family metallopeptidase [Bacteroidota bacterium]